jgi:hypothetical protein
LVGGNRSRFSGSSWVLAGRFGVEPQS